MHEILKSSFWFAYLYSRIKSIRLEPQALPKTRSKTFLTFCHTTFQYFKKCYESLYETLITFLKQCRTERKEILNYACSRCTLFLSRKNGLYRVISIHISFEVSPSYGNQSTVLHGESTDWFLYDRSIGLKWFEQIN